MNAHILNYRKPGTQIGYRDLSFGSNTSDADNIISFHEPLRITLSIPQSLPDAPHRPVLPSDGQKILTIGTLKQISLPEGQLAHILPLLLSELPTC